MKRAIPIAVLIALFVILVSLVFVLGRSRSELPIRVVLESSHDYFVTALGAEDNWSLEQRPALSDCARFTLRDLDNGKVALVSCHSRFVTAPKTDIGNPDWRLSQDTKLDDRGQFVLHNLGREGFALETCAGHFLTAGDGGWSGELAWAVVAKTDTIKEWEIFQLEQVYTPPLSVISDFDSCDDPAKRGREMGVVHDPSLGDRLVISYVEKDSRGCIARLEYEIANYAGFWVRLHSADLRPYSQLVFDIKAEPARDLPEQIKVELKRADLAELLTLHISGITADWQTKSVSLGNFRAADDPARPVLLKNMEELVFVFSVDQAGQSGIVYLDNIALR